MKIDKCAMTQGYVMTTPELTISFSRFEKEIAADMLSIRLYNQDDVYLASVPYGMGEEFGKAWRAMK